MNKIFYQCDRRMCERCSDVCNHTDDIRHAANFRLDGNGNFWEILQGPVKPSIIQEEIALDAFEEQYDRAAQSAALGARFEEAEDGIHE